MTTSIEPTQVKQPVSTEGADDAFVGRRRELEAIGRSLDAVASGSGRLEIVSGAPGIGKTRLTHEVAAIARGRGFYVLRGGCWEGEGAPAYWPWTDALRNHLSALPDDAAGTALDFSQLLEVAATRAGVPVRSIVDASTDAQQARFMLFDHFCEFLAATAAAQPLLTIIDDVQSADTGSLLLLQFLAGRLAKLPVALLITSREPLSEMTASTGRHAWARHLVLRGLSRAEARALLATRAARTPARAMLNRLMHLTDGNPYFLKELGQLLVDGEAGFDATGGVTLPASLLVVTLQPYHRLSLGCRSLLQAASVVGREFDAELTARAAGLPIRDALGLLDEAVERRVVIATGAARYHFAHALVREAIHDQLHPSDRTRLHESIAVALERQAAGGVCVSAATLAHHFCKALPLTQRRQAALYGIAAGESAHTAFAYEEAVFQFRRAQEISGTSFTELESCDLLLRLGAAEAGAGEWARSRRTFEDAAAVARRVNCPERLARAALGFKGMMFGTIPVDMEAITLLREAQQRLARGSLELRARLYSALSRALYFADDPETVHNYHSLAIELAGSLHDDGLAAELAETRLLAHWQPSGLSMVRVSADELLDLSVRLRDPLLTFRARTYRYSYLLTVGNAQQAAQELRWARDLASSTQHPRPSWQIALLSAAQALARGRLTSARQLASRARELGGRVHDSSPAHHDLVQSLQYARMTKDYAGWLTVATQSIDRYPNTMGYLAARALLHAELAQIDESRDSLRHFANHSFRNIPANNFQLFALAVLSEAVVACNEPKWADCLYSLLLPYETLHVIAGWGTAIDGSVAHYLALLAHCMGQYDLSVAHFHAALDANRRLDAPPLLARSQLEYARLIASSPEFEKRRRAHQLASSASSTFESLELHAFAAECQRILDQCSAHAPVTTDARGRVTPIAYNSFVRTGDLWTIRYAGEETSVRHTLGFTYLALILQAAGEPLHVLDLISHRAPTTASFHTVDSDLGSDEIARRAYKGRLKVLEHDIDIAMQNNDLGQLDLLRSERDHLIKELSYSYGVSGRRRPSRSPVERARISVKNRITAALAALKPYHPAAHQHLARSIATGTYCRYLPAAPASWLVSAEARR